MSPSSLPSRFFTEPATITVSTFDTSAQSTTAATGSITGATFSAVASISTTSACLPGLSVPTLSSSPATCAPSTVAACSISRAVSTSFGTCSLGSYFSSCTRARSVPKADRIWVNMSPGTVVTTSMDRLGRRPSRSALSTGGQPCPICTSTCGATEMRPPLSLTSCHSSSLKWQQWM